VERGADVEDEPRFLEESLRGFLDGLASPSPTPGGGSAAALAGALAAALVSMVSGLTVGSPRCADAHSQAKVLLGRSEALREELQDLTETDAAAYASVSAAMKLPKDSDEEKQTRTLQLQKTLHWAMAVPLDVARRADAVAQLAVEAAEIGNVNAVSDAGVAALLAQAAVKAAQLNVAINAAFIQDKEAGALALAELDELMARTDVSAARALASTQTRMA